MTPFGIEITITDRCSNFEILDDTVDTEDRLCQLYLFESTREIMVVIHRNKCL